MAITVGSSLRIFFWIQLVPANCFMSLMNKYLDLPNPGKKNVNFASDYVGSIFFQLYPLLNLVSHTVDMTITVTTTIYFAHSASSYHQRRDLSWSHSSASSAAARSAGTEAGMAPTFRAAVC